MKVLKVLWVHIGHRTAEPNMYINTTPHNDECVRMLYIHIYTVYCILPILYTVCNVYRYICYQLTLGDTQTYWNRFCYLSSHNWTLVDLWSSARPVTNTVPKVIDFPRYNTKRSREHEILHGIFREVSRFRLHFALYLGLIWINFLTVCSIPLWRSML